MCNIFTKKNQQAFCLLIQRVVKVATLSRRTKKFTGKEQRGRQYDGTATKL